MTASLAMGAVYWLRDTESVNLTKLLVTIAIWAAYTGALGLRLRGVLLSRRFSWVGVGLFAAALLSLWPVDASRHTPERPVPAQGLPR